MWWIVVTVALQLRSSYAQLTPQGEAVCVGKQVVLVCQREFFTRWSVFLSEDQQATYELRVLPSQAGSVLNFQDDTSFGFEIHVLTSTSSSNTTVLTELRVTAVRQLNGVTVECRGGNGNDRSTIQIASVDPPAAPSGVMTTADQSQFTPSTASITLTWSASSGADNYTIMVTPLLPSGKSIVSTTTTSLQLTVLYNEEYSINITALNCAGSNSTIVPLTVVGCSTLSPLANGSISEYSSGAVGAMLTFQCDAGYMPQEEVTSICLSNSSWVPTPECKVIDCGIPLSANRVVIEPFNNTKFGALITFHCEESNKSMTAMCGSDGEWDPDPASINCPVIYCDAPPNASGVIIHPFNDTKFGALITFEIHCEKSVTAVCSSNGEWSTSPASLKCGDTIPDHSPGNSESDTLSTESQVIISTIICSVVFLLLGMFLGALFYHYTAVRYKQKRNTTSVHSAPPSASAPAIYEEVSPDSHIKRRNDNIIELSGNVAYGPVNK